MKKRLFQADLLLLVTALIWGGTFVIVKQTLEIIQPLQVIAYRFTLAFLFLFLIYRRHAMGNIKKALVPGVFLGLLLGIAFITQTFGLKYTTPSTSAFITGLNVVMVALFEALFFKRRLPLYLIFGVIAATAGLFILTWSGKLEFKTGDFLTLLCALFFALHIVATGRMVSAHDPKALTVYQFGTVAVISWLLFVPGLGTIKIPGESWLPLLYLGIFATALAFFFQTTAQQKTTPTHTAVILSTEPAFAALIAFILGFEAFSLKLLAGGLLILSGMILTSTAEPLKELQGKIL